MWVFGVRKGHPAIHEKSTILIKLTLWLHTTSKSITGGSWLQMKTFYHGSHVAHPFWVNMGMPWKTNMEMGMSWKTNMLHLKSQAFEKENHLNHPPPFLGSNPSFSKVYVLGCSPNPGPAIFQRHPPRYVEPQIKESQHIHLSKKLDLNKNQGFLTLKRTYLFLSNQERTDSTVPTRPLDLL